MVWHATHPENCIQYAVDTHFPFEEISCLLNHDESIKYLAPLAKTYMDWEYMTRLEPPSWNAVVGAVIASALILTVGKILMYPKRPFQIRPLVRTWNVFWMGVHCLGFLRMLPLVWHNWSHYSISDNVCSHAESLWLSGTTGLWAGIWIYIKMVEVLVESLLVVLLQQSCGLLQWFNNYAYVLLHSYVLYTSKIPGGSAVICIYYGIVWFMNMYCFYLNWKMLPQPDKPTLFLDSVHLLQTMSGVFLTVTTLIYWKDAVHNNRPCFANESHIRTMAFAWSGGQVLIACFNMLQNALAKTEQEKIMVKRTKLKEHSKRSKDGGERNADEGKRSKGVTFAPEARKSKATKANGKGEKAPDLVDESNSSCDDLLTKKQRIRKRNKDIPKNIEIEGSIDPADTDKPAQNTLEKEFGSAPNEVAQGGSSSGKKKKKKKAKKKDD